MIESLAYKPVAESVLRGADSLSYFQHAPVTTFKPGLNILFGPNGSGKSTILQMLAQTLAAAQGGASTVTSTWIHDVLGFSGDSLRLPCEVVHDGQPVMFFDARAQEGLIGGAFDDDFFSLGVANCMSKGSTGELGLRRLARLLDVLKAPKPAAGASEPAAEPVAEAPRKSARRSRPLKELARPEGRDSLVPQGFPSEIVWKVARGGDLGSWAARVAKVEALLAAKCAQGPRTLLFDEPESGFSLPWQAGMWANIFGRVDASRFQVIVATHSPFALRIPGANYIELEPGYLASCQAAMLPLMTRILTG